MSAVAEHAGVRRSTLYRHFPDEAALFEACSAHWAADHPPPDAAAWARIGEPEERLGVALLELYAYYGRTEAMLENLLRDEASMAVVAERFAVFHGFLAAARDVLIAGRGVRGGARRRTLAALGHAVSFSTWKSLVREQGLEDEEAAALIGALVGGAGSTTSN